MSRAQSNGRRYARVSVTTSPAGPGGSAALDGAARRSALGLSR